MTACPVLGKTLADLGLKLCAPTATRTRTYCLGGTFEVSLDGARCGLTCCLAVSAVATCRLM